MFSNDKNIETIGRLVDVFRHYIKLQNEYLRLDVVEKLVRLITGVAIFLLFALFFIITCIYLSFAAAYALAPTTGYPLAFCLVAAFHVLLLVIVWTFRKNWIERPLIRFLSSILLNK